MDLYNFLIFDKRNNKMGAPPKYVIDRKLIRIITKKVIPQTPLIP